MLDHGMLNLPLVKRMGNIDTQLDHWKAAQKRGGLQAHKARVAQAKQDKARALEMIAALPEHRAAELMEKFHLTRKQLETKLKRVAHYTPEVILRGI